MDAEWIKSPTGRRVLVHWADARPAWLWSADGKSLLWRNGAAGFFNARLKKSGLKLGPEPVPIKGQVARLVRLGSAGRSSLSRIQFLAGEKPVSATCTVTPIDLPGGGAALLVVAVDPVEPEVLAASAGQSFDSLIAGLLPAGAEYLLIEDGKVRDGSPRARERLGALIEAQGIPAAAEGETTAVAVGGETLTLTRFTAGPQGAVLLLVEGLAAAAHARIDAIRAEEGVAVPHRHAAVRGAVSDAVVEPLLPMGLPQVEQEAPPAADEMPGAADEEYWAEPFEPPGRSLSSLFDRLASHEELYAPLPDRQEPPARQAVTEVEPEPAVKPAAELPLPPEPVAEPEAAAPAEPPAKTAQPDDIAAIIEFAEDENDEQAPPAAPAGVTYRVTGRGFRPVAGESEALPGAAGEPVEAPAGEAPPPPPPDAEVVERVSRYNFDELSRILTDRVGAEAPAEAATPAEPAQATAGRATDRALVNVAAETFILNRLPIGIMVFRDQQVLFANRALTDLVGYETIEALRGAGLASIFPSEDAAIAGPVTHLMHRTGTQLPVVARLQSITWQGRPALMLSANPAEGRSGYEGMVRAFAEALAGLRGEGFIACDRAGIVRHITPRFAELTGGTARDIIGKPLAALIEARDAPELRRFLEKPAKFAETARPSLEINGIAPSTSLLLFAEGHAGVVSGYFGFLRLRAFAQPGQKAEEPVEPSMLARVSRGVRRPLNTIIGFADLIRSAAFGTVGNQRYLEYARDIKTAGQEIAALVDELDDIARLKEGSYAAQPAELDLGGLLETCVVRVRDQASAARVLVRSAISERLPRIRADRASLRQAVLNLLASAIDQTPPGGTVVLSAQLEDDGSIAVNVRDSGGRNADPAERFVVFRDGVGKDGEMLVPMRSSVGLALTRSLLAVNTCSLSVDPAGAVGTLFSLMIPAVLVAG